MAFKGDILRINVWSEALKERDVLEMAQIWSSEHEMIDIQKRHDFALRTVNSPILLHFTVIALIRIPIEVGDRRVGVICGNYPKPENISFEVHSKGRCRLFWNYGEVDLYGKTNVADGECHCVVFTPGRW